jgi:hypothetical protein
MKRFALMLMLALATPAFSQPQPQQTPSQVALQLNNVIASWAQALEALQKENAELQQQLGAVTKERDELKASKR